MTEEYQSMMRLRSVTIGSGRSTASPFDRGCLPPPLPLADL
jgi:hypothetical protein